MASWWPEPFGGGGDRYHMVPHPPPFERFFGHGPMHGPMQGMERSLGRMMPYWMETSPTNQCNIGNAVGKVVDDREKFAVELDVSQFHPEELQVNVRNNELVVEGHHEERNDANGSIERHFVRKYTLPKEANQEALVSHLSDKGLLSVSAPKQALEGPPARKIPIQPAPRAQDKMVDQK